MNILYSAYLRGEGGSPWFICDAHRCPRCGHAHIWSNFGTIKSFKYIVQLYNQLAQSTGNVMLQTDTLVVFAATFAIAGSCVVTGTYRPLTRFHPKSVGCRSFSSHVSTWWFALRESSEAAAEVGGSDVFSKVVNPVMALALNSCNRASSGTLFLSLKIFIAVLQIITYASAGACRQINPDSPKYSERRSACCQS